MIIRKEQIKAFSDVQDNTFDIELHELLKTHFEERYLSLGKEKVHELIVRGKADASKRAIDRKADIARFITLMFSISVDFDQKMPPGWVDRFFKKYPSQHNILDRIYEKIMRDN